MTDLTPSAADLAAITLNGRRLTPEQSSWLVGSLQHERAYCSTPGELLELLSHPTPPPAPEVEAIRARDALMTGEAMYPDASPARQAYRDRRALLTAFDVATQRAETAERAEQEAKAEYDRLYALANDARLALNEAGCRGYDMTAMVKQLVAERDAARATPPAAPTASTDPLAPDENEAKRLSDITGRLHRLQRALKMPMRHAVLSGMDGDESVSVSYGELWWLSFYADTLQDYVSAKPSAPTAPSELRPLIRSKLFQQFLSIDFWDAHHVDLLWRYNGQDVREEADWLKDVWYHVRGKVFDAKAGGYVDIAALSAPGSEAPKVVAYLVTEGGGGNPRVFLPGSDQIDAAIWMNMPVLPLTPLPASPAAGKEAM